MKHKKIYLTQEGLEELKKEHADLSSVRRPQIVQRVAAARDMGDLSENGEYTAARDELAFVDGRIEELEILLKEVEVIHHTSASGSVVELGTTVKLKIDGQDEMYTVVGEWEADPIQKKISHESPLGKALLGKKTGESIEVQAPAGTIKYTIVSFH